MTLVPTGEVLICCDLHQPGWDPGAPMPRCCDVNDCGPCCPDCPTCPSIRERQPTIEIDDAGYVTYRETPPAPRPRR